MQKDIPLNSNNNSQEGPKKITGTYVYDKDLNKVIKVSDRIPGVSAKKEGGSVEGLPCGQSQCHGGTCPMKDS